MLTLIKPLPATHAAAALTIDKQMRAKLPALPNPLVATWTEQPRLVLDRGMPWLVTPLESDPYTTGGGYPFPSEVATQLQRISAAGARFHRIAIAHELDPHGPVEDMLDTILPAGLIVDGKTAGACLGETPAPEQTKNLAGVLDKAVKTTLRIATATATAAVAAPAAIAGGLLGATGLDPIVFGVIGIDNHPRTGEPAIYYPLAAWRW
jgi:hypothetical protein